MTCLAVGIIAFAAGLLVGVALTWAGIYLLMAAAAVDAQDRGRGIAPGLRDAEDEGPPGLAHLRWAAADPETQLMGIVTPAIHAAIDRTKYGFFRRAQMHLVLPRVIQLEIELAASELGPRIGKAVHAAYLVAAPLMPEDIRPAIDLGCQLLDSPTSETP